MNPKDSTKKLPELINDFGKVAGYTINTQASTGHNICKSVNVIHHIKKNEG